MFVRKTKKKNTTTKETKKTTAGSTRILNLTGGDDSDGNRRRRRRRRKLRSKYNLSRPGTFTCALVLFRLYCYCDLCERIFYGFTRRHAAVPRLIIAVVPSPDNAYVLIQNVFFFFPPFFLLVPTDSSGLSARTV